MHSVSRLKKSHELDNGKRCLTETYASFETSFKLWRILSKFKAKTSSILTMEYIIISISWYIQSTCLGDILSISYQCLPLMIVAVISNHFVSQLLKPLE